MTAASIAGEEPGRLHPGDQRRCQVIVRLAGLMARPGLLLGRGSGKRRNRSHHADALKKFPPTHAQFSMITARKFHGAPKA